MENSPRGSVSLFSPFLFFFVLLFLSDVDDGAAEWIAAPRRRRRGFSPLSPRTKGRVPYSRRRCHCCISVVPLLSLSLSLSLSLFHPPKGPTTATVASKARVEEEEEEDCGGIELEE